MIHVIRIDIIITIMPSFIQSILSQRINFCIDEKIINHQDTMIINHSITAANHSTFQCQ